MHLPVLWRYHCLRITAMDPLPLVRWLWLLGAVLRLSRLRADCWSRDPPGAVSCQSPVSCQRNKRCVMQFQGGSPRGEGSSDRKCAPAWCRRRTRVYIRPRKYIFWPAHLPVCLFSAGAMPAWCAVLVEARRELRARGVDCVCRGLAHSDLVSRGTRNLERMESSRLRASGASTEVVSTLRNAVLPPPVPGSPLVLSSRSSRLPDIPSCPSPQRTNSARGSAMESSLPSPAYYETVGAET